MEKKSHKDDKKTKENALKDRSREDFSVVTFIAGLHGHLLKGDPEIALYDTALFKK